MGFDEAFQDVADWVWENYPAYKGWKICSFAWGYYVASSVQELCNAAFDAMERDNDVHRSDFDGVVERVNPPEGYAYVTFRHEGVRVGFNVPTHVFQKQTQPA
jgi:hypothetical protein